MSFEIKSMNSSEQDKIVEQGRAIARGMEEIRVQKEKNQAREAKRRVSLIRNAAERELFK